MTQPADLPSMRALQPWSPDPALAPAADPLAEPEGFVVASRDVRLHFLDWRPGRLDPDSSTVSDNRSPTVSDGPDAARPPVAPGVLLIPGLLQPAWSWAPVARRLCGTRVTIVEDLRGQGLSDSPPDGYDLDALADDAIAVAEGSGLAGETGERRFIVAGHGLGGIVAAATAARLGARCAGLVLVDGGWERLEATTELDEDELLRGLDEPPEVMRSMDAWLADRRAFDPSTWDVDQERTAREAVVETAAGRVVRTVRPFVVESLVRTMFRYEPLDVLGAVEAPVVALVALGGGGGAARLEELDRVAAGRGDAGRSQIRVAEFAADAHNLMRYRPAEVAAAILGFAGSSAADQAPHRIPSDDHG